MPIRKFDVEVAIGFAPEQVEWPFATLNAEGEVVQMYANLEFIPIDEVDDATARAAIDEEERTLARISAGDLTFAEVQEAEMERQEEQPELIAEQPWLYFDLGVRGAAVALAHAGAVPISTCNAGSFEGDALPHQAECPLVVFHASSELLRQVCDLAQQTGCGVYNSGRAAVVYSDSVFPLVSFARRLFASTRRVA